MGDDAMKRSAFLFNLLGLAWFLVGCSDIQPPHYNVVACPSDANEIQEKWDLWRYSTCLRGANIWQKVVNPATDGDTFGSGYLGPPYLSSDFAALAAMGANYVNFSVPGIFTVTPPYAVDPGILAGLNTLLDEAQAAGLFVVLSFRTGPGRNENSFSLNNQPGTVDTLWTDPTAQAGWVSMWQAAATAFQNRPGIVGYNLMVEPNANEEFFQIWNPTVFYSQYRNSTYDWNVLSHQIAQAVRAIDSNTPILVGAMDSSDPMWLSVLQTSGVAKTVYGVHQYDPPDYTSLATPSPAYSYPGRFDPYGDGEVMMIDRNWIAGTLQPVSDFRDSQQAPVSVNEYGVMRWEYGSPAFIADELSCFESLGLNHAIWLWESSWPKLGYDQFNFRHGTDPTITRDVTQNPLEAVISANWAKNRIFLNQVEAKFTVSPPASQSAASSVQ
jgi:hypothetical protein